ncbi:ribonuclease E/G [Acetobacter sp. DsW_063]|uniref:Rne/Rng family ribonuclease n=1 Tax=Acetobacter sp. DsW_063 TaxID=1514894 RepID=UPI000A3678B0|nr:ribonuclease E/G [Acetobacter sp. DsW_063]OUJ15508.1 ribonuclease E [Acetobacter sp. DsW_063]
MTKRMLIDATHAEETRVVVMDGNRLEDYDVEAANRKQLKGNIYLAKVIRVEPSLQAAFVEYGGNRHGFLAFSEIHPDYYQIPVADREKLLALQEEDEAAAQEAEEAADSEAAPAEDGEVDPSAEATTEAEGGEPVASDDHTRSAPDYVGGETDTGEEALVQKRMARFLRSYKIQEVIRRRQILLVQVVKEERGNKGAALTTYVSLAGRYCVLMPNALRGGGVSRKITAVSDRKRLKEIIAELQLPRGMAMIVRTAGAQRPRPEVMRDCEYLLHLWDEIREHTMKSVAPTLIYEEASLVKRAIRDVYTRDVEEIVVDGEPGWRSARDFMRMLMPQSAQKVVLWRKEHQPLFSHYQVEGHLDAMLSPTVQLRSGGYLVINQTEALVSIDVNSGRATRERNIEETAVKTNLEAADEVARQLRLRDLAGLIVIDFIDMESRRHNAQVERRLKDALRNDRARIQVGGISHFGLLEMSRQRLRPSVAETAFMACPHCQGTGIVRGIESSALHVLRAVEDEGALRRASEVTVHVAADIALYILNNKRDWVNGIETRHKMRVYFAADATLPPPQVRIERHKPQTARFDAPEAVATPVTTEATVAALENRPDVVADDVRPTQSRPARSIPIADAPPVVAADEQDEYASVDAPAEARSGVPAASRSEEGDGEQPRRRRRRRRRRGGQRDNGQSGEQAQLGQVDEALDEQGDDDDDADETPVVAPDAPNGEDAARAAENLVPGRMRTRHSRKGQSESESAQERPQQRQPQAPARPAFQPAPARQPQPRPTAAPVWRGPTPADPFGGNFDIFDMMDQAEREEAPPPRTSQPAPVEIEAPIVVEPAESLVTEVKAPAVEPTPEPAVAEEPARRPARRRRSAKAAVEESIAVADAPAQEAAEGEAAEPAPRRRTRTRRAKTADTETPIEAVVAEVEAPAATKPAPRDAVVVEPVVIGEDAPKGKARTGWWKR